MPQSSGGKGRDYRESDLRVVLVGRGPFRGWDEVVRWLRADGRRDGELRPGDVDQMLEDLWWLSRNEVPFTDDPGEAYRLAHTHRPTSRELKEVGAYGPHRDLRGPSLPPSVLGPNGYLRHED